MPRPFAALSPRRGTVGLILLLGLGLSCLIWFYATQKEQEKIQAEFTRRAQARASLAHERLFLYEEMIYSLRGAFAGHLGVTRQEFRAVAREIFSRHKGVQALAWVELVDDRDRAEIEAKASGELGRPFHLKQRTASGEFIIAPKSDRYAALIYIEPLVGNEAALGYDLNTAPTAGDLADSINDRQLKVSHPIRLAQSTDDKDESGVVFILPVLNPHSSGKEVIGFAEGVFQVETMLAQAHLVGSNVGLRSYYFDEETEGAPTLLYANLAGLEPLRAGGSFKLPELSRSDNFHHQIKIGNRSWTLIIEPDPAWIRGQKGIQPTLLFAAGLAITTLLALFINSLLQRTGRVEQEASERTAQLHDSEARLQAILDHSPALIFVKDLAGKYVLFNKPFADLCQRPDSSIKGRSDQELFPAAQAETYRANDRQVLAAGHPMEFEENSGGDGARISIVHKFPLLDAGGKAYALCGIASDITERKQSELELQENRRQLSTLISQLPGAAFRCLFDENLTALFASEGMLPLTGFPAEEFTSGRIHLASLTVPADRPRVRAVVSAALTARHGFEVEHRITHHDGQEKWVLVRGRPIYDETGAMRFIEGLAIDVTALKQAEAEKIAFERNLLETQKLESLGVMAGGIAHDFNNILAAILGNATLMRYSIPQGDHSQAHLEQIENAARRAADLCAQMLAYAGKGKISTSRVDLSTLVRDTTSLLEVSTRKNCSLSINLAAGLPPVLGDATQLSQIIMNLVLNGSDAIGDRAGGEIVISTFVRHADTKLFRTALHQPKLKAGRYVGLEVRDNGSGMTAETISRIFEPFYTTKFSGRGLGLSAVLGIVHSHHGALFIESKPGQGSTFQLLLPAADGVSTPPIPVPVVSEAPRLSGTVLVADDESSVRVMLEKVLRHHGASVLLAADGTQALELYRSHRDKIDLILLDLTMPGLSGEQVLAQLQKLNATQTTVIMSGYSEEETMQRCATLGVAGFISKPFELTAIVSKLQSLME